MAIYFNSHRKRLSHIYINSIRESDLLTHIMYYHKLGVNIHCYDNYALKHASSIGNTDAVQYLLQNGGNYATDDYHPVKIAIKHGCIKVLAYYMSIGLRDLIESFAREKIYDVINKGCSKLTYQCCESIITLLIEYKPQRNPFKDMQYNILNLAVRRCEDSKFLKFLLNNGFDLIFLEKIESQELGLMCLDIEIFLLAHDKVNNLPYDFDATEAIEAIIDKYIYKLDNAIYLSEHYACTNTDIKNRLQKIGTNRKNFYRTMRSSYYANAIVITYD